MTNDSAVFSTYDGSTTTTPSTPPPDIGNPDAPRLVCFDGDPIPTPVASPVPALMPPMS